MIYIETELKKMADAGREGEIAGAKSAPQKPKAPENVLVRNNSTRARPISKESKKEMLDSFFEKLRQRFFEKGELK